MFDEFELELLDLGSELVLVEVLFDVFVLVFPACAELPPTSSMRATPIATGMPGFRRLVMMTSTVTVRSNPDVRGLNRT